MTSHAPHCSRTTYAIHVCRKSLAEALSLAESIEAHNRAARKSRKADHRALPSPLPYLRRAAALAADIAALERGEVTIG